MQSIDSTSWANGRIEGQVYRKLTKEPLDKFFKLSQMEEDTSDNWEKEG